MSFGFTQGASPELVWLDCPHTLLVCCFGLQPPAPAPDSTSLCVPCVPDLFSVLHSSYFFSPGTLLCYFGFLVLS